MLYGKYADGSIWAPRGDGPRLLEDMNEVLEEYVRNIFRAYGREYSPSEDWISVPTPSVDTGLMDVRLHPDTPFLCYGRTGHGASRRSGGLSGRGRPMPGSRNPTADVPALVTSEDMVG